MDIPDSVLICRIVGLSIISDAQITDEEHDFLEGLMDRYGLRGDQRKLARSLNLDDDPVQMVSKVESVASAEALISELARAIMADHKISPQERAMVDRVGQALGFEQAQVDLLLGALAAR